MKKLSIFLSTFLFSATLTFENNVSIFDKNTTSQIEKNISQTLIKKDFNKTENNLSSDDNLSTEINITSDINLSELNISEINISINPLENNTSKKEINISKEKNLSIITPQIKELNASFVTLNPSLNIGIVFEKRIFNKYKKDILNSILSYLLYKKIDFDVKVFNDIKEATNYYENILYFTTETNLSVLKEYPNNFFFPVIFNDNKISDNLFFGGINFQNQIKKLVSLMEEKKGIIINSNTILAKKLTYIETKEFNASIIDENHIDYKKLENNYIFFNTPSNKTAQILSNISFKNINTKLQFSSQINYDPLLIKLTQPEDVKKLLISNSIINFPLNLDSINTILNTNIRFNWLNYTTSLLLNKIYNLQTSDDPFFLNDFKMYMFNNQIEYKTKIYQIINKSFRVIY